MAVNGPIKNATSLETSIEIIPQKICQIAMKVMQKKFLQLFPKPSEISLIPILRAGRVVGKALADAASIKPNPMQMSYYKEDTTRLKSPICIKKPDMKKIVIDGKTLPVVFAEAVVDSQATLLAAMTYINNEIDKLSKKNGQRYKYPVYHTFALVSKTDDNSIKIPNLTTVFKVDPDIWIFGCGCDLAHEGRRIKSIRGILSPLTKRIPQQPYYQLLFNPKETN